MCVATVSSAVSETRMANSSPPRRAATSSGAQAQPEPLADRAQERVAGRVAEGVVDELEVVEVDEEHDRDRARGLRVGDAARRRAR